MTTSLEYFRQLATEFDNIADTEITAMFTTAGLFINVSSLDADKQLCAVALYAAHLFWIKKYQGSGGGQRGIVVSEKDDKLERKYQAVKGSDDWFGQSSYGALYLKLNGATIGSAIMTRF